MTYAIRSFGAQLIVKGKDTDLSMSMTALADGSLVDLSGGVSVSVYDESGAAIHTSSAVISGTSNEAATITVLAAETTNEDYSAFWSIEWSPVSAGTGIQVQGVALVVRDLHCPITDQDLYEVAPELIHTKWTDADGVDISWDTAILAAYKSFYSKLAQVERWPWKVVNPYSFREYLVARSLSFIYMGLGTDANERYDDTSKHWLKESAKAWAEIRLAYDRAEDRTQQKRAAQPFIIATGGPRNVRHHRN